MRNKSQKNPSKNSRDAWLTVVLCLFHFLIFFTPLFFTFNTSELFEFNKMVLTYAVTILILGAWLTRMVILKQVILKRTYLDIPIVLFVISQFLSTILSMHPNTSFLGYYSRFHGGLLSTLTYVALYYAFVSNVQKKHLHALLNTMLASGFLVSLYAGLEHFGHSFSCFMVENGRSFGVDCWIQDVKNRVFASFGQPNWLAAYLIMLIPVSTALSFQEKQKKTLRIIYTALTVLFFLVLLYTHSRSGFFGLAVGMIVFTVLLIAKTLAQKSDLLNMIFSAKKWQFLGLVIGVIIAAAVVGTPISQPVSTLFKNSLTEIAPPKENTPVANRLDVGGTDSGEIRKIVWQGAFKVWQRYPIWGSGVETFAYSYYLDRPMEHNLVSEWDFLYNKAHNEFLNFLATTGIAGLLSYLTLLGWFSFVTIKQIFVKDQQNDKVLLLVAGISGIAALSVSNFFGFSTVMVTILMYLYFGLVAILTSENLELKKVSQKSSEVSYLLFSVIAMATIFLLNMVYQYWRADVLYSKGTAYLEAGYFEQGMPLLQEAIKKNPTEALFYDTLATQYSRYALGLAQDNQLEEAQQLMVASVQASDAVQMLNPHQLNFYKTRAGVFITLAQLQPALLNQAKEALLAGIERAPTDPKLIYNLGIVEISMENQESGIKNLEKAVEMKPNYEAARVHLANQYEATGRPEEALIQFNYVLEKIAPHNQIVIDKISSLSAELK